MVEFVVKVEKDETGFRVTYKSPKSTSTGHRTYLNTDGQVQLLLRFITELLERKRLFSIVDSQKFASLSLKSEKE